MENVDVINAFSDDEDVPLRKQKVVRNRPNHFEVWDNKEFCRILMVKVNFLYFIVVL
jgi:hypothetical protein